MGIEGLWSKFIVAWHVHFKHIPIDFKQFRKWANEIGDIAHVNKTIKDILNKLNRIDDLMSRSPEISIPTNMEIKFKTFQAMLKYLTYIEHELIQKAVASVMPSINKNSNVHNKLTQVNN